MNEYEKEQLFISINGLNKSLIHIDYLFANEKISFIDRSSLAALRKDLVREIERLRSIGG